METSSKLLEILEQKNFKDMTPEEQFAVLTFGYSMRPMFPRKSYQPSKKKTPIRDWLYAHGWYHTISIFRWKLNTRIPPFSWFAKRGAKKWNSINLRFLAGTSRKEEFHYLLYYSIFEVLSRFVENLFPKLDPEELQKSSYYEPFKEMQEIYDWWRLKGRFALEGSIYNKESNEEKVFCPHGEKSLFKNDDLLWSSPQSLFPEYTSAMAKKISFDRMDADDAFRVETMMEMFAYMKRIIDLSPYMEDD